MANDRIKVILDISAETKDIQSKVSRIQTQLNNIKIPGLSQNLTGDLQKVQERIKKLQELTDNPLSLKADLGKTEKEVDRVSSSYQSLLREVERLKNATEKDKLKLLPEKQQQAIQGAEKALKSYNTFLGKEVKKTTELINAEKQLEKIRKTQSAASAKKVIAPVTAIDQQQTLKELEKQQKEAESLVNQKRAEYEKAGWKMNERGKHYKQDAQAQALVAGYEKATKAVEDYRKKISQTITQSELDKITTDLQNQEKVVNDLTLDWDKLKAKIPQDAFDELRASADKLGISLNGIGTDATPTNIQLLQQRLLELRTSGLDGVNSELIKLQQELNQTGPSLDTIRAKVGEGTVEWEHQKEALDAANHSAQDLANLKNQILDFFSVTGAIQLFRRAITSAVETVKELDAAMTEIAVVSDFSVNDMWGQLPKFTDQANQLGVAISDTYEATTLFVQQGLDLDNSMKLATETLKMAAIAGMNASDATNSMTSALRGFNMELNETSAQRVNDVYSELAAISAADTQEISTAMSKVASLAHNVNMEFETTSAFLTQGIETTRESAETIGTSLKTVLARFSEVKSLYTKGQLTGTDDEGEAIDVNKVQTALRSAGVDMTEFLKGNEGLDQVLLRLSERWNDLDILTQRYIATMASGSRQQSRFISMISDYSKTMELVDAAYNSTGASQRQFEKTLDSLQAKLTKLENAWNEFTMGLANNELIGLAVESLTTILELINGIINGLSGGNGLIKSVLTLGTVIGGLKLGGSLFDKLLSKENTQNFIKKFRGEAEQVIDTSIKKKSIFQKGKEVRESFMSGFSQAKQNGNTKDFLKEAFFGTIDESFKSFQEDLGQKFSNLNPTAGKEYFEDITKAAKEGKITFKEYSQMLSDIYGDADLAIEAAARLEAHMKQVNTTFQKTGKTIMAASGAFMALGAIVSQINPELGKVISTIGGIGMAVGGLIQAIPSLTKGINGLLGTALSAPQLAAILVGITAIALVVSAIVKSVKENSPEAKLEKAQEATDKAKKSAEEASKAYDDLLDKKKSISEMETGLESLTKGSLEWKKAIVELNNEILKLKSSFPELEITLDETTGALSIKNFDTLLKTQMERVRNANANLALRTIDETNKQAVVDRQSITSNDKLSTQEKVGRKDSITQNANFSNISTLSSILDDTASDFATSLSEAMLKEVEVTTSKVTYGGKQHSQKKVVEETIEYASLLSKLQSQATKNIEKEYNTAEKRKTEYEKRFGKDSTKDLSDNEIKQGLIDSSAGGLYRAIGDKISTLGDKGSDLVNILAGQLPQSLSEVIGSDLSIDNFWDDTTGKTLADALGISPKELKERLQGSLQIAKDTADDIKEVFEKVGVGENFYKEFSYSTAKGLSTQIVQMSKESAEQYLSNFSKIMDGLDESKKKQLQNYLSSVDLTDMVDVSNARDFMESLGMDKDKIAQFWGEANKYCKAYISSLEEVDTLNSKITNLGSARELVSEGQMSFSSDEKTTLISAGFNEEDFVQTGFDEWTYAIGDTNTLLQQIDEKVGIISNQIVDGLENGIELGKGYKDVIEGDDTLKSNLETLAQYGASGTSFSEGDLQAMANSLGINTTNLNEKGIAQALIDAYNLYKNLGTNIEAVERQQMNAASLQYETNGDFGVYTDKLSPDQQEKILQAQLNKNAGAQELYNKLLKESGRETEDFQQDLADQAIQLTKTTQKYKEVASSIDDYKDALLQGENAGTDFYAALNSAKKDLSELFNVDSSLITDEFIQQYIQDIYNLAEGGEVGAQAFNNLQKAIGQVQFEEINKQLTQSLPFAFEDLANYINELKPTLEVQTLVDDSPLNNALLLMAQNIEREGKNASATLAPVLASIEALTGTSLNLEWEYEYCGLPGTSAESDLLKKQGWQVDPISKRRMRRTKGLKTSYSSSGSGGLSGLSFPDRSSSGSGGSSSEKKETTWENPYDKLYNLTEEINEALRQREKLEREYDRILERRGSTFGELRKNYNSQINSLKEEIRLQEQLRGGRLSELNSLSSETYKGSDNDGNELIKSFSDWGVTKYANYNPNTGVITIDWNAIDKVKDENTGGAIEAYISRLEELQEQIEDVDTQIEDFEDKVLELQKEGMQDYLDFEQKVYDAIVNQQQELIDNFQSLSNELAESNKEILTSIQDSIDLQRQIRDNTKTEEDINEKEARLAYLRRDTSNANLLEIKQLEDELADSRQDYEDSLIDQQLERLSKQNDDAQTAREKQIELMQAQLDYSEKNGEFWNQTYELIMQGFSETGDYSMSSNLWNLLQKDEGWKGMSKFGQLNWQEEISKAILAASQGYANWNMYKAEKVDKTLTTGNGRKLTYDGKQWKDSSGNIYNGVDYDSTTGQFTYSGMTAVKKPSSSGKGSGSGSSSGSVGVGSRVRVDSGTPIYSNSYGGGAGRQYYANDPIYNVLDENNGYYLVRYHRLGSGYTGWFKKSDVKAYKKGGLADFTGPAWLDGTKSSPELILTARDTENFIELKNILGSLMKPGVSQNTQNSVGDMYFDININVDEISNDYDVEQLGKKIKQDITNDAMYRNVNLINLIR